MIIKFIKNLFNFDSLKSNKNGVETKVPSHIKIGNMVQFRPDNLYTIPPFILAGISKFDSYKCSYVDIIYAFNEPCMILEFMEITENGLKKQNIVKVLHNEEVFYVHESDLVPIKNS